MTRTGTFLVCAPGLQDHSCNPGDLDPSIDPRPWLGAVWRCDVCGQVWTCAPGAFGNISGIEWRHEKWSEARARHRRMRAGR